MARTQENTVETQADESQASQAANGATLATAYADYADTYTAVIDGFTIPVRPRVRVGDVLSDPNMVRLVNMSILGYASRTAQSNSERGSWKDLGDDEKLAKIRDYVASYKPSDNAGSDTFGASLLEQAATRVLIDANADKLAGLDEERQRKEVEPHVARLLNSPEATERYRDSIGEAMAEILATRHAKRTRNAKSDTAVEIAF